MKIHLLRHGELEGGMRYRGRLHSPLTTQGEAQMHRVWQQLADRVDMIYSSPLQRCHDIAYGWSQQAGLPFVADQRIQELDYGEWEGLDLEQLLAREGETIVQWRRNPEGMCPPGGESMDAFRQRVQSFCDDLHARRDQYAEVLIVGHSGSLRMLLQLLLDLSSAAVRKFHVPFACWSCLQLEDDGAKLVFHNPSQKD